MSLKYIFLYIASEIPTSKNNTILFILFHDQVRLNLGEEPIKTRKIEMIIPEKEFRFILVYEILSQRFRIIVVKGCRFISSPMFSPSLVKTNLFS